MNAFCEKLSGLLDEYDAAVREANARRKPGEGILGFGKKLSDDPCHGAFDRKIASLCEEMASAAPSDMAEAVALLFQAERDRAWLECARWMLVAVQRHALPLIPLLPEEEKRAMLAWYGKRYPAFQRLPVQQQIVRALQGSGRNT